MPLDATCCSGIGTDSCDAHQHSAAVGAETIERRRKAVEQGRPTFERYRHTLTAQLRCAGQDEVLHAYLQRRAKLHRLDGRVASRE